jgi:flagellar biosynthesis protein FlgN
MSAALQVELGDALSAVLDDMQRALAELADALASERAALLAADVPAIDAAGARKQALMQALEQLDTERQQLAATAPRSAAQQARWQELLGTLRECRDLNQRNGGIVQQRLGSVRRALAILTGQDSETGIYGRSGAMHARARSNTLAEV